MVIFCDSTSSSLSTTLYLGHAAHNFKKLGTIWLNKEVSSGLDGAAGGWKVDRLNSCLRLGPSNIANWYHCICKECWDRSTPSHAII